MIKDIVDQYGIKQIGYYAQSIEETAAQLREALGAGPFIDLGISEPASCEFRGEQIAIRSRCALGQLGGMQLELIESHTEGMDPYQEMGRFGIHHFCIWADDVDAVVEQCKAEGIEPAMTMVSGQGLKVVYLDAREQLGQYIEVNAPIEQLAGAVAAVHAKWEGDESVIGMDVLMKMMGR